jgi:hypothetical protein
MRSSAQSLAVTLAVLLASAAAAAPAAPSVPDLQLSTLSGTTVKTGELLKTGKWLLVTMQPNCQPCLALLHGLNASARHVAVEQIVFVVAANVDQTRDQAARFPRLATAIWCSDPDEKLAGSLQLTATPVMLGIHESKIAWRISGIPPQSNDVAALVRNWLGR